MIRLFALTALTASVLTITSPAVAGTLACKDSTGLGAPPSFYVCQGSRGPGPLDACFRAGVAVATGLEVEYSGC